LNSTDGVFLKGQLYHSKSYDLIKGIGEVVCIGIFVAQDQIFEPKKQNLASERIFLYHKRRFSRRLTQPMEL
jgi:hypothetical protein